MTDKFAQLKISDVLIPKDIIVDVPPKHISSISTAFGTDSEILFFIIAVVKDGKYHLVDRYDVYVAAKTANCKNVRAFVISGSDDVRAHLTLSMKHFPNPATVIRMITPFVEQHGLEKTLDMFYLDTAFGKMYKTNLSPEILTKFESVIQHACSFGIRSIVPVQLFEEISRSSVENQSIMLENIRTFLEASKSKFRWPHKEFLRMMDNEPEEQKPAQRKKEKTANTDVREFECSNCKTLHIVTPTHIGPKKETNGIIIISDDDNISEPVYSLPLKHQKYLGVSKESPPVILSSKDTDWESLKAKLTGKKFVVYVGEDT